MKKAIFLFNRSRHMLQPWLDAGYECWTFDGQLKEGVHNPEPGLFEVGMWFDASATSVHASNVARIVGGGVKFIASFAECTYLTTTGARWLYHPEDRDLPIAERDRTRHTRTAAGIWKTPLNWRSSLSWWRHIAISSTVILPPGLSRGCWRTRRDPSCLSCGASSITPSIRVTMAAISRRRGDAPGLPGGHP